VEHVRAQQPGPGHELGLAEGMSGLLDIHRDGQRRVRVAAAPQVVLSLESGLQLGDHVRLRTADHLLRNRSTATHGRRVGSAAPDLTRTPSRKLSRRPFH
jgi:hypothetical protein